MGVAFSKEEQPPDFLLNGFDVKKQLYNSVMDSNRARAQRAGVSLGVLCLDSDDSKNSKKRKGDINNPDSFEYPVHYKVVSGLTYDQIIGRANEGSGKATILERDELVKNNLIEAIAYLEHVKNVTAITADNGCMMWLQDFIQRHTSKPVMLSPIVQLPTLMVSYTSRRADTPEIAILTANTTALEKMYSLIQDECGINLFSDRFRVIDFSEQQQEILLYPGLELEDEEASVSVRTSQLATVSDDTTGDNSTTIPSSSNNAHPILQTPGGVVTYVQQIQKAYPKVCSIVLEWTALLPFGDEIRRATKLPVYDSITACDMILSASIQQPLFSRQDWQHEFDGLREVYKFNKLNLSRQEWELLASTLPSATWVQKPTSVVEQEQHLSTLPVGTYVSQTATAQQQQDQQNDGNQPHPPLVEKAVVEEATAGGSTAAAGAIASAAAAPAAGSSLLVHQNQPASTSSSSGQQQQQQQPDNRNDHNDHLTLPLTAALLAMDETE